MMRAAGGAVATLVLSACYGGGGFDDGDFIPKDTYDSVAFDSVPPVTPPTDNDGDGYATPSDCDDDDPTTHPDVAEDCADAFDNDCDRLIDDADPDCEQQTYVDDLDGDGYPAANDCDDADPAIYPQAPEICDDQIDNDCDLYVDAADPTCP